ncbi:heparanase-like protein 1 [Typha angustifolia]|uniref:heparanase-like protein 1 n=1 Tax=Typha angustifolia TaxID=59011 RepID=UPI003C2CA088
MGYMIMGIRAFFLSSLLISCIHPSFGVNVTVTVQVMANIGETDDSLICTTLDWWPKEKCNYGMCPWHDSSIINLDLRNPILHNAVKAFKSLRIRLGGSLQDQVIYKVGRKHSKCQNFQRDGNGLFGFTEGCLTMSRWDKLNHFFRKNGAIITFGLNALYGRNASKDGLYEGDWDARNARSFIRYTLSRGYKVESWEFGNELSGTGISARLDANQCGKDLIRLKNIINKSYKKVGFQPKLLAPGGFFDAKWFADMLRSSGPNVVDVVTHHIYNLGAGVDKNLIYKIQDPYYLSQVAKTYRDLEVTIKNFGPWSSPWVGESGGAYNSGGEGVSNAFVDSFWYLDQLGMVSTFGHKVFCRQSLIGGNYALLDTVTFIPNPDYYSALLWHRLMGKRVLRTTHDGSVYLRSYTHCSRDEPGVTVLLINLSNSTSFDVSVIGDMNLYPPPQFGQSLEQAQGQREEYHLTPQGGNLRSRVMLLNGEPLELAYNYQIPEMQPAIVDASTSLRIAPLSMAFVRFKDLNAPACV